MEKLQPIIAGMKKHNFWIVLSLVCLMLVYFWWISTPTFSEPFEKNVRAIDGHFRGMTKLRNIREYPNRKWIAGCDEARGTIDQRLNELARENHADQRSIRDWGDFGDVSLDNRLGKDELAEYWQQVLPAQVETLKDVAKASVDENATGKLTWNRKDFDAIVGSLTPESVKKYQQTQERLKDEDLADDERKEAEDKIKKMAWPDTGEVIAAQEIVWVYQALLDAVNKVNDRPGVDAFNLPIRSIEKISVWPEADEKKNAATLLGARRVRRAGATTTNPASGRGLKVPKVKDYYRVVPVRIELQMEHEYLAPLLVALSNQRLTCEVVDLQLTSNPGFTMEERVEKKAAARVPSRSLGVRRSLGGRQSTAGKTDPNANRPPAAAPRGKRTVVEALIYVAKPPKKSEA